MEWKRLLPSPPLLFSGAVGGPCVMFAVTPFRNALSLASADATSSTIQIYREVFKRGGWTGGLYPMIPAVPQFCVIGPMFHVFRDMFGGSSAAAVFATATCETLLAYGAETRNAQLAVCGKNAQLHNPLRPFGPGVSIHLARNALAMSGLRVLSDPCRRSLSTVCDMIGIKINDGVRTIVADLGANLIASALSMPLHQLYGFTVIEAAKRDNSKPKPSIREQITSAQSYLRRQFLVPGSNRISRLAWRDIVLRCSYNATIYTVYGAIERSSVALWKERGW